MKNVILTLLCCLSMLTLQAQSVILDFESPATTSSFLYFSNGIYSGGTTDTLSNFLADSINPSNTIGGYIKGANGNSFAGAFSLDTFSIDAFAHNQICIKVWAPALDSGASLVLKLEIPTDGSGAVWGQLLPIPVDSQWVTLCFDLDAPDFENNTPSGRNRIWQRLTLFFGFGYISPNDIQYYFDDIIADSVAPPVYDVRMAVDMNNVGNVSSDGVYISGNFQEVDNSGLTTCPNWTPNCTPMADIDSNGVWFIDLKLTAGQYQYKFLNGKVWSTAEGSNISPACGVFDGFSGYNRRVLIQSDTTIGPFFFNSCDTSAAIIEAPIDYYTVDLAVSTLLLDSVPGGALYITGDFLEADSSKQTACPNGTLDCLALTDDDHDGIWQTRLHLPIGTYRYRFVNDGIPEPGDGSGIQTPCATADTSNLWEREMTIAADTVIGTLLFNRCGLLESQSTYTVTFVVDMNRLDTSQIEEVYVMGNFQQGDSSAITACPNWTPGCTMLDDTDHNGVYALTLDLIPGLYKYAFGTGTDLAGREGNELNFTCGVLSAGNFFDRIVEIKSDTVVGAFYFNSCDPSGKGILAGIEDDYRNHSLGIFPNPAHTEIEIEFQQATSHVDIGIWDMQGREVLHQQKAAFVPFEPIDIRTLEPGVYFLRLQGKGIYRLGRFIKQ